MRIAAISLTALLLAACGAPEPPLVVSELEVTRPMPGRHMSAGFFVVTNNTDEVIRITAVESPQFANVEIHETTVTDGISRMREIGALEVPANGSMVLERGGKHLMLMRPENVGDSVTLQFYNGDTPLLSVSYAFPEDK